MLREAAPGEGRQSDNQPNMSFMNFDARPDGRFVPALFQESDFHCNSLFGQKYRPIVVNIVGMYCT